MVRVEAPFMLDGPSAPENEIGSQPVNRQPGTTLGQPPENQKPFIPSLVSQEPQPVWPNQPSQPENPNSPLHPVNLQPIWQTPQPEVAPAPPSQPADEAPIQEAVPSTEEEPREPETVSVFEARPGPGATEATIKETHSYLDYVKYSYNQLSDLDKKAVDQELDEQLGRSIAPDSEEAITFSDVIDSIRAKYAKYGEEFKDKIDNVIYLVQSQTSRGVLNAIQLEAMAEEIFNLSVIFEGEEKAKQKFGLGVGVGGRGRGVGPGGPGGGGPGGRGPDDSAPLPAPMPENGHRNGAEAGKETEEDRAFKAWEDSQGRRVDFELLPTDELGQIDYVARKMSDIERDGRSYSEPGKQYDKLHQYLQDVLKGFTNRSNDYYKARVKFVETDISMQSAEYAGDVQQFIATARFAGPMQLADILLQRDSVAKAMMNFELLSKNIEYKQSIKDGQLEMESVTLPDGRTISRPKMVIDRGINPALAKENDLTLIRGRITLDLLEDATKRKYGFINENGSQNTERMNQFILEEPTKYNELVRYVTGDVKQAEVLWRIWMRAGLKDGVIFKYYDPTSADGMTPLSQEKMDWLLSLKPAQITDMWGEYIKYVDTSASIDGSGELVVKRLLHTKIHMEKNTIGEPRLRHAAYVGSQDFLSNFLDDGFLTDSKNFRTGQEFKLVEIFDPANPQDNHTPNEIDEAKERYDASQNPDERKEIHKEIIRLSNMDKRYERVTNVKDANGELVSKNQSVTIRGNQVFEFGRNGNAAYHELLKDVIWTAKGNAGFTGAFEAYKLILAEQVRGVLVSAEGLPRNKSLNSLLTLNGKFDNLDSITKDLASNKDLDEERAKGKIYREDIMFEWGKALLGYQTHDKPRLYRATRITFENVELATDIMLTKELITEEQAEEIKVMFLPTFLQGLRKEKGGFLADEVLIEFVSNWYRANPSGAAAAMMAEFLKLAFGGGMKSFAE